MTPHERTRRKRLRRIRITGWTALTSLLVTVVGFLTYFHIVFPAERSATLDVFRDDRVQVEASDARVIMSPQETPFPAESCISRERGLTPTATFTRWPTSPPPAPPWWSSIPCSTWRWLDTRGVSELTTDFPDITSWVLAGHSLGGVKACMEASHPAVTHLVLFASYCANDISGLDIEVFQVVGDRDGLLDDSLRREAESLLPPGQHRTFTIRGANHADFGTYGPQPGDGESAYSNRVMRTMITGALTTHVSRTKKLRRAQ
jgi:hypothetical protein